MSGHEVDGFAVVERRDQKQVRPFVELSRGGNSVTDYDLDNALEI